MFNIILVSPEIPANTGNIIRLAANTGANLHLIRPLGFQLDDKRLKRAGLDYHEWADIKVHDDLRSAIQFIQAPKDRLFAISTKGKTFSQSVQFQENDCFIFGRETSGLRPEEWEIIGREQAIRLPMKPNSRSLNLSNAVAVVVYEAWRQINYQGGV
ncbi:tRNA (cytidine(34)-2'-O)-methyltransferase [Basilea psittacipulmonis]|uniref:tRNA (cytidine(34)-2'-O)-methyltransferase n=1 Tax=Basilea psittacipulmonis DSM 24701 TaxID=1072685 RepID=A0A077DFB2_9BURK|nr:tRNA (cytidine(34)-2'-O)-methyltransferase [Basilea psittacipulmonis]AIL32092.1 rRNA methylase [Basilea psittacipulmonis DSM 24701]